MTTNNEPAFLDYPAIASYSHSTGVPMHYSYDGYTLGESRSCALIQNQVASSSRGGFPNDLPELYYDQDWPSPHSTTSSNMISTPPPEWQARWQLPDSPCISNNPPSPWQEPSFSSRQATRPTVAPIDTSYNWKNHQSKLAEHHSMLFASQNDFDSMRQVIPDSSPFFQTTHDNNVNDFGLSSSSKFSSSLFSTNILPSTLSEPLASSSSLYPPTTSQPPLKLHQPRPFRRIPIVSLSNLASACDDFAIPSHTRKPNPRNAPAVDLDSGAHSSLSSFAGTAYPSSHYCNKGYFYPTNYVYSSALTLRDGVPVIMCPCGYAVNSAQTHEFLPSPT
ncbi:hypothetical protein GALMADRAFT_374359 [Galerina marginata CBS 339.88]|uniref:Uncharacterized protein n=1 Tax=Galerina marginata (strain CBS 339.88) TaxID=685588 RepID=A0A067TTG0_GALM3|nr:hypothetical protein GALMADRAFT_374359 [Galerina marginata CBS 339.88]